MTAGTASRNGKVVFDAEKHCGAKRTKRGGEPCTKPKGWGTSHPGWGTCKLHGGSTPNGIKAAVKAMHAAEMATMGEPREIDPHDALLEELHRTAGHVAWLQMIVGALDPDEELVGPVGGEGITVGQFGTEVIQHARKEPSVWVKLYQDERNHYARIAKTCIEAGIEERRVQLAEQYGQLIAGAINRILDSLGLTKAQMQKAPRIVREVLTSIDTTGRQIEA